MRKELKQSGVLIEKGGVLLFTKDSIFSSPSASAVVLACRANGWIEWEFKDGKTLDQVFCQKNDGYL